MIIVVRVGQGMETLNGGINAFTPKIEAPVDKGTIDAIDVGVFDKDGPSTNARFAPATPVSDDRSRRPVLLTSEPQT